MVAWEQAGSSCKQNTCYVLTCAALRLLLLSGLCIAGTLVTVRWTNLYHRPRSDTCEAYLDSRIHGPFSVILTADPGDFSGTSEAHYIIENLKNRKTKPRGTTVCGGHFQGLLMRQEVLVVTTGIGAPVAGLCTLEVVTACGHLIKDIVYFGTSGWSPQLGGVLDPPNCDAANTNKKTNRLGDVCISPFTVNWTCKKSSWAQQAGGYPNQCYRPPEVASPNATILFGECQFYKDNMEANLALADELLDVVRSAAVQDAVPRRSSAVTAIEQKYWQLMGEATGLSYPVPQPSSPPTYYDYTQCMEVDGQYFYSGVPFEVKARDYAAQTLTDALGTPRTSADVVAVSAMEGIGVAEALLKYHALVTTKRPIPYTHVRTLSNWLHQPVKQVSPGVWETAQEMPEDFVTGYGYAIATGSATLMSLYQHRCQRGVALHHLPHDTDCTFVIDYNEGRLMARHLGYPYPGKKAGPGKGYVEQERKVPRKIKTKLSDA